ncbi:MULTISPECIES: glycosyltransferase [Metabacillus]|uniref:Glycosyltransferase n=1 Tax=Metabacillus hrfriensis TaxID=3048891 RepID=A0ACD4RAX0_9BACI|nr:MULTISPECIES: glycosyltransferase [Metabacillus]UAL52079.1 beta(1,3)galactosyltransferase EpsH [Metabacillus dongyingensis]WHZ57594.1 glycosyltransferase [Metabacillus sp. CT-WN-B3]
MYSGQICKKYIKKLFTEVVFIKKILVLLGTQKFGFERLINHLSTLADDSKKYEFTIQTGYSSPPKNSDIIWFDFKNAEELNELIKASNLIITHAGTSSINQALTLKKPIIIVPRRQKYNEHVDDHQLEMSDYFHGKYEIPVIHEIEDLNAELLNKDLKIATITNEKNLIDDLINYMEIG